MLILCFTLCGYFIFKLYELSIQSAKNTITLSLEKFEKQFSSHLNHSKSQYLAKSDLKDSYRYGILFKNLERVKENLADIIKFKTQQGTILSYEEYALVDTKQNLILSSTNSTVIASLKANDFHTKSHFFYSVKLKTFILIDPIYDTDHQAIISWLILKLNPTSFTHLIHQFQKQLKDFGYINNSIKVFDDKSRVIFVNEKENYLFTNKSNHFVHVQDSYVSSKKVKDTNYYFAIIIPTTDVHKEIFQAIFISFSISSIVFIFLFIIMYLMLRSLVIKPILLLTKTSQQMKEGNLNQKVPVHSNDEIGMLARSFEEMSKSIQTGIDTLESKVEERTTQLKDQNQKLQSLMDILSHDLKNPIGAIQGLSQLLLVKAKDENHQEILTINQTSNRVLNLVDDLVGKNAIANAKIQFNPDLYSLESLIQNTFLENQTLAHSKDIQLEIDWQNIDDDVDFSLFVDSQKILQVLNNLVSNAIKFSNSGDSVTLSIKKLDNELKIGVIDHGLGILNNDLDRLISIDQRTTTLGTHQEKGTGIGLPLVQELLSLHQSTLQYQSLNPGSFFYFHLKLSD